MSVSLQVERDKGKKLNVHQLKKLSLNPDYIYWKGSAMDSVHI